MTTTSTPLTATFLNGKWWTSLVIAFSIVLLITALFPNSVYATHFGPLLSSAHSLSVSNIGDSVEFGNTASVALRWKITEVTTSGYPDAHTIATLITESCLPTAQRFHLSYITAPNPLFKGSELVTWLNSTSATGFLGATFSQAERDTLTIYGTANEAHTYLTSPYTIDNSVQVSLPSAEELAAWSGGGVANSALDGRAFWLRNRGYIATFEAIALASSQGGTVYATGVRNNSTSYNGQSIYARPVIKVDLNNSYFPTPVVPVPVTPLALDTNVPATITPGSSPQSIGILIVLLFGVTCAVHHKKTRAA